MLFYDNLFSSNRETGQSISWKYQIIVEIIMIHTAEQVCNLSDQVDTHAKQAGVQSPSL